MHVRRLTPLLALWVALPVASAQNFEHDLRPAALEGWREAGQAVDIDGDWAIVEGLRPHPNLGLPAVEDLPALFRFDPGTGEWAFHASLAMPDMVGFPSTLERVAIDAPHAMLGTVVVGSTSYAVQPWRLDPVAGVWSPLPRIESPLGGQQHFAEVLDLDGATALIADFGYQGRGVVHRYEFDAAAAAWTFAETWSAPAGAGSFGFGLDLDGDTAAVFDLDGDPSASSRVHVYERGVSGWAHLQTLAGGLGPAPPSWLYGSPLALDGDVLALANGGSIEIHRRAGPGQPFVYEAAIDLGSNQIATSIDLEDGTLVVGNSWDCTGGPWSCDGVVRVFRDGSCLGPGWRQTHELRSAYRHNFDIGLGASIALSGGRVVAGMTGFQLVNGPFHGRRTGSASIFDIFRDCDGNGVEDACDILAGEPDFDGDGVLDACEMVGRRYCSPGNPTYLGEPAYVLLQGSDRTDVDRMFFTFVGVPPGAPGLMLASRQPGFAPNPAGSNGDLCLGEPIGRFAGRTHSFWFAGQDGVISQRYPMTSPLPGGGPMLPGETWFFQGWFREAGSSNWTDAIQLVLQ